MKYKRIILIILDSVGCGYQKDYKKYNEQKSNTLLNVYKNINKFKLPNLEKNGLKKILFNINPKNKYCAGKIQIKSKGNDTLAGVWEMIGVIFQKRFRSTKKGLSLKNLNTIQRKLRTKIVGNEYISGINAINKYYNQHIQKNGPILYFDKDGVALLAAHSSVINTKKLNVLGKKLSALLTELGFARVITRPFTGKLDSFKRTRGAYFSPIAKNLYKKSFIPQLKKHKIKIITTHHLKSILGDNKVMKTFRYQPENKKLLGTILKNLDKKQANSLILYCLQDFDRYGHLKDVYGYGEKLKEFDSFIPQIKQKIKPEDLVIITADHGCDPAFETRGHTREFVPIIILSKQIKNKIWLGERKSLADIGQTIAYNFSLSPIRNGEVIKELF